jgi:hypothetical protein
MPASSGPPAPSTNGVMLTAADFDELVRELELRRGALRAELAQRLRDARAFGSPGDDDEWLAVLEDVAVDRVRVVSLPARRWSTVRRAATGGSAHSCESEVMQEWRPSTRSSAVEPRTPARAS